MNRLQINSAEKDRVSDVLLGLWMTRELVVGLAKRDLRVKYMKTRLGLLWSFLNPILMTTIFTFFFSEIIHFSAIKNSTVFVLSAYLGWYIFSNTLIQCTQVLKESEYILEKVKLHRLILITARLLSISLEQFVFTAMVLVLTWINGELSSHMIFLLPICYVFSSLAALGVTFVVTGLSVNRQDVSLMVPHLIQIGIWLTPIFYAIEMLPNSIQFIVNFNPMNGLVNFWRYTLYSQPVDCKMVAIHLSVIFLLFFIGLRFFIKRESLYHKQL